jgi:hypothetical protein
MKVIRTHDTKNDERPCQVVIVVISVGNVYLQQQARGQCVSLLKPLSPFVSHGWYLLIINKGM